MNQFERLVELTAADYELHIVGNPLMVQLSQGEVTQDHYVAYLIETFHLVRHTSRCLALAAARLGDERRGLRAWLLEQAGDEHGHELFCLNDLRQLGVNSERALRVLPGPGAWGLVAQNYYMATYGNPVGLLGVATATEGMGASLAGRMAQVLEQHYGIPHAALTFLRSHAGFDQRHLKEAQRAVNEQLVEAADFELVVHARRMTYRYYGQLFKDACHAAVANAECVGTELLQPVPA